MTFHAGPVAAALHVNVAASSGEQITPGAVAANATMAATTTCRRSVMNHTLAKMRKTASAKKQAQVSILLIPERHVQ
jgi:hypothetical protein